MALVETKELTLTKIGGNSSMTTPKAIDLKGLDEVGALRASAKNAKEQNKKLAEKQSALKVIDSVKTLQLMTDQARNLSKTSTATKILDQINMASEALEAEITKAGAPEATTLELPSNATDLEGMIDLSGGNINSIVVWRIDGDVDFYLPWNRIIFPDNDVTDETPPRRSMRDFDLPAADLQLIAGDPKIISINGTRYKLGNQVHPTFQKKGEEISLDDLKKSPTLGSPSFLKVGGNSEFATPDSKTLMIKGEQGEKAALALSAKKAREINKRIAIGEPPKQTAGKPQEATNLEGILELSGGEINAIFVWRIDGDIDFYLPENRKIVTENGASEDIPPKWSMRHFELPAADLQLITGEPKIASINGTRYILGNKP